MVAQHLHDIHAEVMTWLTTMKTHLTEIQLMLTPIQVRDVRKSGRDGGEVDMDSFIL